MDLTLLHPKIVHLPIALAILMPLISGGLLLAWWRDWLPRRTWVIAVLLQVLLVASSYAALETGEIDEERVERVVAERFLEAHEEAAEIFMWLGVLALVLTIVAAIVRDDRFARALASIAVVSSFAVLASAYQVGEAGGALVYEHGAAQAHSGNVARSGSAPVGDEPVRRGEYEDDDDD